jgi:hypothetical protein
VLKELVELRDALNDANGAAEEMADVILLETSAQVFKKVLLKDL